MRLATGKAVESVDAASFRAVAAGYRLLSLDIGTGDGALPYRLAAEYTEVLCVGLDPNAGGMADHARRAGRKTALGTPARGGRANCVYVVGSIEEPPEALAGLADVISVHFPWAALLEIVLGLHDGGDAVLARALDQFAAPDCVVEFLVNEVTDLPAIPTVTPESLRDRLGSALDVARFTVAATGWLDPATRVRSRWGGRLIRGSGRRVVRLRASRGSPSPSQWGLLDATSSEGSAPVGPRS
jgi:16S rRNA (adenine(1408)-N(1))-methyltransferase